MERKKTEKKKLKKRRREEGSIVVMLVMLFRIAYTAMMNSNTIRHLSLHLYVLLRTYVEASMSMRAKEGSTGSRDISSPNTVGLRQLQHGDYCRHLLEGLKRAHTHPEKSEPIANEDPNGMTAKTLKEMKKKLDAVPGTSAAAVHDKKAYD